MSLKNIFMKLILPQFLFITPVIYLKAWDIVYIFILIWIYFILFFMFADTLVKKKISSVWLIFILWWIISVIGYVWHDHLFQKKEYKVATYEDYLESINYDKNIESFDGYMKYMAKDADRHIQEIKNWSKKYEKIEKIYRGDF